MNSAVKDIREVACIAINELSCCKETLFQIEALFFAMQNEGLARDTLDQLIVLGAGIAGDLANDEERNLETLRADLDAAKSALRNAESQNVARNSEGQP
ncbi:hypothetical protein [Pseudomonas lactis]|uniref:Uncharacterized protein n=1 Tax=Pseudomonas lactis TaxID=1615674 RepID=A0A7Y1MJI3_9PSED|nr:hypothetical protein [Pseudomonas lactis]KRP71408.1 hypothetical protein TX24_29195 [Pseudomonas lactis]NNA82962.1 hypothetical protein [Pseudomonas lactis]